ncbi:MAG: hypothetical protein LC754_18950 [Acidobacteria bacterium]|nr:hypothetical protein [Acidobacteriota bacterium]
MNTMLRTYGSMVLTVLTLMLASCSRSQGPPTVGELKEFGAVYDKGNDGKRVAVEGYLAPPSSFKKGEISVMLRLYQSADFTGKPIGVQMPIGGQANQMEMPPKKYSEKDLKVHLADGQVVGTGTKMRVSGTVYFPIVDQDFTCGLANPLVERAK